MKTLFFATVAVTQLAALDLTLPFQLQPVVAGDNEGTVDIDVADIARLQVRLLTDGETGIGKLLTTSGANRYELDGTSIVLHVANADPSVLQYKLTVSGVYGQVKLNATIVLDVKKDGETSVVLDPYVFDAIAAGGGGGEYKADVYMDGAGRVILERLEDGSTLVLDEHENPIMRRNADGSTQYYDAYQSARLGITATGDVMVNSPEHGTLVIAEAILARTRKRLLTNTAGETTIKDEEGNVLTHADIYAMLMESPDFVVLVRSDHAFHPNLVTGTQIAFTCSYLGADGAFSTERVNITSEGVFLYTNGKALVRNAVGGLAIGAECEATGNNSFAEGYGCKATGAASHAEGTATVASGQASHAEGSSSQTKVCEASGENSHAEGLGCVASGKNSHAEGSETVASGDESHAEGVSDASAGTTTASAWGAHAEGRGCKAIGVASHAEGLSTKATGFNAHAEGSYSAGNGASGTASHTEGVGCYAIGENSHAEGYHVGTSVHMQAAHAQGIYNFYPGTYGWGKYSFSHGCGTSESDRQNALLIKGSAVYIKGIGGFDGKNDGDEGVLSLQEVLANMLNPEVMALSLDDEQLERVHYSQKPIAEWTARDLAEENADRLAAFANIPSQVESM